MKTIPTLDEFNGILAGRNLRGQWLADPLLQASMDGPKPRGVPFIWKWDVVYRTLLEACEVLTESSTARRNVSFINPALQQGFGTTHTLVSGVQIVTPGEVAWSHRHTIGAIRFGIEGSPRLYSVVDGEPMPMEPNDLVLTPNWTWHDHHNDGDGIGIWLDVLDVPLSALSLNQTFYEELGDVSQPCRQNPGEFIRDRAHFVRPAWERRPVRNFPFRYAWSEVKPLLERLSHAQGSPYDGTILEYVNPMTGGSTLPTMGCFIQSLPVGFHGKPHRQSSSTVYYVVQGSGTTVVDGRELDWSERDNFVVPNWTRHHHVNRSETPAILFSVTDQPLLDVLGLYREDPEDSRFGPAPIAPANIGR
jgi:1-hydroxy-2-naphthoate dioxygenase